MIASPVINSGIDDGDVSISLDLSDLEDLVVILRLGAPPLCVEEMSFGLEACG